MWTAAAAFNAALLLACIVLLTLAAGLEPRARLVPVAVLLPLAALLIIQLAREIRVQRATRPLRDDGAALDPDRDREATPTRLELAAIAWIAGLGLLVAALGLLAGTGLFVLAFLRWRSRERWPVALGGGVMTVLALWLLLTNALGTPVTAGAIGTLVTDFFR